ncbi:MAG TPA: SgcJ/EcaC family oxidoreductase [Chitinophagaceae bacterium]|jgi:uncharacterized protein (TIGR02246 family)
MNSTYNDEIAVRKLHDEVVTSFNTLDVDKLLSLHSDDIILMEPNMQTIRGKEEIKKLFKKLKQQAITLKLSFNIYEMEVFGERAFVRGQVIKTTIQNNKPVHESGKFITLSRKQKDGSWLRTHVIANSDMPIDEISSTAPVRISMGMENRLWER